MNVSKLWLTADTHFGHRRMAGLGGWRPFQTVEEHDETLIENWNKVVKPDDHVWHLGDVGMGGVPAILRKVSRLKGHKHLVAGNHDQVWAGHRDAYLYHREWLKHFETIHLFARRRIDTNQNFILSHMPYQGDHVEQERYNQWRPKDEGLWVAHGHVHAAWAVQGRQVNVGVDVRNWAPMSLEELVAIIRGEQADVETAAPDEPSGSLQPVSG